MLGGWALGASALFVSTFTCPAAKAANVCVEAADTAQDLRSAGKLREARAMLLVCSQRTCNSVVRSSCEKWLREVDEQTPALVVRAADSRGRDVLGARITIDDMPAALDGNPIQVDPGRHVIRARARSGDVAELKILAALGEKARVVEVRFDRPLEQDGTRPAAEPKTASKDASGPREAAARKREPERSSGTSAGSPALPIALATIGAVALGAFGYFEISGQSGYSDLENGCYRTAARCSAAEIDPVRQKFVAAGISLGISVVALGAAAIVYFTRGSSDRKVMLDRRYMLSF